MAQTYGHAEHLLAEAVPDLVRQPQECLFVLPTGCADYVVENGGHDRVASQPDLLQPDPRYFGGVVQHRRAVVSYLRSGMFGSIFQGAVGCGRLVGRERSADRAAQLVITGQIHFRKVLLFSKVAKIFGIAKRRRGFHGIILCKNRCSCIKNVSL